VSKSFGGVQTVRHLSFAVRDGEISGSHSGRTVSASQLVNLINGVFTPEVGRIRFSGVDITGEPPYHIARRGLARTHQIVQPLINMTVFENCTVSACFRRENLPLVRAGEAAWGAAVVTRASEHQSRQQHRRVG
jgi:branched-chain amino acid transport system ATP-binding protein